MYSGLHFGHYEAAAFGPELFVLHAQKLSLCAQKGVQLARRGQGVTLLLEKICGNNFVYGLRDICLFEANFNWWNKLVFARRMMTLADKKGSFTDKLFARKGLQCADGNMYKPFFTNASKIMHHSASILTADFSGCYDRTAHTPQSITLQAFRIPRKAAVLILLVLQII